MTVEERVKMLVGDLMVNLQMAQAQIEDLQKKIAELEGLEKERIARSNVESIHRGTA